MRTPIILDTDIGTDVDDAFALVMAVKEPNIDLRAVSTVYGDVDLRARIARKLLDILGRSDIPVVSGSRLPLYDFNNSYWGGWEGKKFLTPQDADLSYESHDAVGFIHSYLMSSKEKVTLVGIGPLTNLGILIKDHPDVREKISEIICMAGTLQPDDEEWNVQCDPAAAEIVLTSRIPLKLGTRHFVNQPWLTQADRDKLNSSVNPEARILVDLFDEFLSYKTRTHSPMYDPVTLSMAFTDQFIQTELRYFSVQRRDHILYLVPSDSKDPSAYPIQVPIQVKPRQFIDYLIELLMNNN